MNPTIKYSITPEPGQLVEVRKRQWIVADVKSSQLPISFPKKQHYVTLSSIDEDGLGEELEVHLGDRAWCSGNRKVRFA